MPLANLSAGLLRLGGVPWAGAAWTPARLLAALGSACKGLFTAPATTTTLVSDAVSAWADQSGTGNLAQGTAANRPVLTTTAGRTWVQFDATNDRLSRNSLDVGVNFDLFVRMRYANHNPYGCVLAFASDIGAGAPGRWGVAVNANSGNQVVAVNHSTAFSANALPTLAANTTGILHYAATANTAWASGWTGTIALDGGTAYAATLAGALSNPTGLVLSSILSGSTSDLWVSDLILCDPLTAGQRQTVLDYLAAT